jgi:hypothetical protein
LAETSCELINKAFVCVTASPPFLFVSTIKTIQHYELVSTNYEAPCYVVLCSLVIMSFALYSLYLNTDSLNSNRFMVTSYVDQYLDTLNFSYSSMATNGRYFALILW